jgi:hypothetical protein
MRYLFIVLVMLFAYTMYGQTFNGSMPDRNVSFSVEVSDPVVGQGVFTFPTEEGGVAIIPGQTRDLTDAFCAFAFSCQASTIDHPESVDITFTGPTCTNPDGVTLHSTLGWTFTNDGIDHPDVWLYTGIPEGTHNYSTGPGSLLISYAINSIEVAAGAGSGNRTFSFSVNLQYHNI